MRDQLRGLLFSEWVAKGPQADAVRLVNGVLFREAEFSFGLRLSWLVPADRDDEVLVVRIRRVDDEGIAT